MILAAIVIGLVTAWSFGPRAGLTAAATAFVLFVIAVVVPGLALYAYGVVAIGLAVVSAVAVRRPRHPITTRALVLGRALWERLRRDRGR